MRTPDLQKTVVPAGAFTVLLFRHGPAADRNASKYPDDDHRPLTPAGRKRVKAAGRGLRRLGFSPDAILHSPARRTRETAEILAEAFRVPARALPRVLRMEPALHVDTDPAVLVRKTLRAGVPGRFLWVGHEPWLGEAAGLFTGASPLSLRKAGAALVEVAAGRRGKGTLRALVPPEWLVAMGGTA